MTFFSAQWIGWLATSFTVGSYFCRNPRLLRLVQATAAMIWICYGVVLNSQPVIVANVLVTAVAIWSTFRGPAKSAPAT